MPASVPTAFARTAVEGLFDDASLFPPARAPMEAALGLHALAARSSWGFAHGRFLVPVAALGALVSERRNLEYLSPLELGVIVGSPADPVGASPLDEVVPGVERARSADPALVVRLVEYRPADQSPAGVGRAATDLAAVVDRLDGDVEGFVEVDVTGLADASEVDVASEVGGRIAALAGTGIGAKVRCGGLEPTNVPAPGAVAAFIAACVQHDLPFKATAGLHHALSASAPERRFGYLNLLTATVLAHRGADLATIATVLEVADAAEVTASSEGLNLGGHDISRVDVAAARSRFVAFGTCSFTEPLTDLLAIRGMTTEDR